MKNFAILFFFMSLLFVLGCTNSNHYEKGFQVGPSVNEERDESSNGINKDSLKFDTRPGSVLLTGIQNIRITPIYKVNYNKREELFYTGSNGFHYRYDEEQIDKDNNWHNHLMPGLEAVYGFNMVNISHYSLQELMQREFFEKPVLIRTVYFPCYERDTLNKLPVSRDYFLVSAYNEDTNKDGFINIKDLRRFFFFNIQGKMQKALVPENYAVMSSEYDPANDLMLVSAQCDSNKNGQQEQTEPIHIFWIDLKNPASTGRLY